MLWTFAPGGHNAFAYRFAVSIQYNMLSSWCQYEALKYVSFPTQMLFKCFKLFPIMVMGKLLGNKNYPPYDYGVAAAIGVGIAVFSVATEDLEIGQDAIGEIENVGGTVCGIALLLFSWSSIHLRASTKQVVQRTSRHFTVPHDVHGQHVSMVFS